MLEFDLVVSLKFFFGVASLKVDLNLKIAYMCLDNLLFVIFLSLCLGLFEIGLGFPAFLSLELLLLLLLSRLPSLFRLNNHGLSQWNLDGKFEIGSHQQLVHLEFA